MSAYLQCGHDSWNLLDKPEIGPYRGVVLSPVNDGPEVVRDRLGRLDHRPNLEVILDPQLYNPDSERGRLNEWRYFPSDFATADPTNRRFWSPIIDGLAQEAASLGLDAICSPAPIPRVWSDEYFRFVVDIADEACVSASAVGLDGLLTAIVRLRDLADPRRALDIASILSGSRCDRVYLMFLPEDDLAQRQPLNDGSGLPTALHLVWLLSRQMRVHVAFSGHDLTLWKTAGATDISTGKFLNLRRFSPSRWGEENEGGRQNAYWNEGELLTTLRDQDVARLSREGWFDGRAFDDNPAASQIFEILSSGRRQAWVALSWLQYMRWAANAEGHIRDWSLGERLVEAADARWGVLENRRNRIQFIDRWNSGEHARIWLNAIREASGRCLT